MKKIIVKDLIDLEKIARDFLLMFKEYKIFAFFADMGSGKTTFIRKIVEKLDSDSEVTSPTFSIVNEYLAKEKKIYHFDFYRIKNIIEAYDIGVEDYFYSGNLCFIEWAENIEKMLPKKTLFIYINKLEDNTREFVFTDKKI